MSLLFESSYYAFAFYTAVNALVMLVLGMLVTRARVRTQTEIGHGGKPEMAAPLRAHANNTEWTPMALLMMWVLTLPTFGASIWIIQGMGITLTLGRVLHGVALSRSTGVSPVRLVGMVLTWVSYIIGIVAILWFVLVTGMPAT